MKNDEFLTETLKKPGKIPSELRFFARAQGDTPERELGDCRIPVILEAVTPRADLSTLVQFTTLETGSIPYAGGTMARYMDLVVDDRRVARVDLLRWLGPAPLPAGYRIPARSDFTLDVEDPA